MKEPLRLEPLFPDRASGEQLTVQLARRLRTSIEDGTFAAGSKMLGSRQLARRLGLGRNTVALVFEQLVAEGYLETRRGSGTFVAKTTFARARREHMGSAAHVPQRAGAIADLRTRFSWATGEGPLRPGTPAAAGSPPSPDTAASAPPAPTRFDPGGGGNALPDDWINAAGLP